MSARQMAGVTLARGWLVGAGALALGAIAAIYGLGLGSGWHDTLALSPLDPGPAAGLLAVALLGGGVGMLGGLMAMVTTRWTVAPLIFAAGVGLCCGVAIGFLIG